MLKNHSVMTAPLAKAKREFQTQLNLINFGDFPEPTDTEEGSIERLEAVIALKKQYLNDYPELNNENYDLIGFPIYRLEHDCAMLEMLKMQKKRQDSVTSLAKIN